MPTDDDAETTAAMTRGERVRAGAKTLRTPRTASWVAEETGVSVKTAQKYLDQLVEDNVLRSIERDGSTYYCIDQLMATYREIASLQREYDRDTLTDTLETMRERIATLETEYGVETPGALRASIADVDDTSERERRRDDAAEWEHLDDRVPVIKAALTEYDWAETRDVTSA